jgi:hypothetical protein
MEGDSMEHYTGWLLSAVLMLGCAPGDSPGGADTRTPTDVAPASDTMDAEERVPVLWGEPVDAPDAHSYCMKVSKAGDNPCNDCVCTHCDEEVVACYFDEGCTWMRECTFEHNCAGWECFGPCGDVFARHGGKSGPSGSLIEALGSCGQENCPVCLE